MKSYRYVVGRGFNSRRLHQDKIQQSPKKYRNPLEIAGFLLIIVQRGIMYSKKWVFGSCELKKEIETGAKSR